MRILYLVHQFMPEFASGTEQVTLNLAKAAQSAGHYAEVATLAVDLSKGWRLEGDGLASAVVEGVPVCGFTTDAHRPVRQLGFEADAEMAEMFDYYLDRRPPFDAVHVMHELRLVDVVERLAARRIPYLATLTDFFSICHRINLVRLDGTACQGPEGGTACAIHCPAAELPDAAYPARYARLAATLRAASAVTAVSDYVARQVRAEIPGLDVRVIGNGVDLLSFPPAPPRPADRPLTFGYLGTVSESKGAALLVEAFVRAAPADARLSLFGPCYEPELEARLKALATGYDVIFHGAAARGDVAEALSGFDVLCVPSKVPETFSLALHEGFAAGLPALVSDLGNLAAVVGAHGCGEVIAAGDVAAWAAAISQVATEPARLAAWREHLPLPMRVEEEAFLYSQLYRAVAVA